LSAVSSEKSFPKLLQLTPDQPKTWLEQMSSAPYYWVNYLQVIFNTTGMLIGYRARDISILTTHTAVQEYGTGPLLFLH
jgi:hypothetical protein